MTKECLLRWLSKEDSSSYGECHGKVLDELMLDGLVEIVSLAKPKEYSRVALTEAGWAALGAKP